jgi:hypothetical protein
MSAESITPENPAPAGTIDPETYSHLDEVRRLRAALARLEAQLEQVPPDNPAMVVRLAAAIARLSDSVVRALAAHHKLQVLAEKNELQQGWNDLKAARDIQQLDDQIYRRNRAKWFREEQVDWLLRVHEAAEQAASGEPDAARKVADGLKTYIDKEDYTCPPDRSLFAGLRGHPDYGVQLPWPSTPDSYSTYT